MSKKNVEPERVRKGPMTVEEIKAMRAAEGMIVDLEDEGTNVYIIKAYQEKMSVAVGRMYKQARREMGLTQQEVADVSGVKRPNIARLESGKHSPTVDMLNRIADSMGMDMEILLSLGSQQRSGHARSCRAASRIVLHPNHEEAPRIPSIPRRPGQAFLPAPS